MYLEFIKNKVYNTFNYGSKPQFNKLKYKKLTIEYWKLNLYINFNIKTKKKKKFFFTKKSEILNQQKHQLEGSQLIFFLILNIIFVLIIIDIKNKKIYNIN